MAHIAGRHYGPGTRAAAARAAAGGAAVCAVGGLAYALAASGGARAWLLALLYGVAGALALAAAWPGGAARGLPTRTDRDTGCLDAGGFAERLEDELAVGGRRGQPVAIALVELLGSVTVPDLREAASRLVECTRPGDAVGRVDERSFGLLLPATVKADARVVADRASAALAPYTPARVAVAGYPEDGLVAAELHRYARSELYGAEPGDAVEPARASLSDVTAFARAQDRRMIASHDHSWVVGELSAQIARRLGWNEEELSMLRLAAFLHDVGKVAIPERVLMKPGPLTPAEFVQMAAHPVVGAKMLSRVDGLDTAAEWVLRSHERFDGSGYPDGLAGEAIPLGARILHVADAFDAMTAPRPHQLPLTLDDAVAEIRRHTGTQFDPQVVAVFEAYVAEVRAGGPDELASG